MYITSLIKYFIPFFYFLFLYFWPCHEARGILVPRPGIQPAPPAQEAHSLNHWAAREVPRLINILNVTSHIRLKTVDYPKDVFGTTT